MKKRMLVIWALVAVLPLAAQSENLFHGDVSHGFHFSPELKWTRVKGENNLLVGGSLGWIVNHWFSLGLAGYGMVGNVEEWRLEWDRDHAQGDSGLAMGYGGVLVEFIVASRKVVHLTVGVLLGAGGVGQIENAVWHDDSWDEGHSWEGKGKSFLIAEPKLRAILNFTDHLRMGFGVSYRFIDRLHCDWISEKDLKGAAISLSFHLGKF